MSELPVAPPNDLTIPTRGSTTARSVLSAYLKHQLRTLIGTRYEAFTGDARAAEWFRSSMREIARANAGALFSALRHPHIGGLLRLIAVRDGARDEISAWCDELFAQTTFELAMGGISLEPPPLRWPRRLISLTSDIVVPLPADTRRVRFETDAVVVGAAAGPLRIDVFGPEVARPFVRLRPQTRFSAVDNNPRAALEAHPEKSGNALDLGGRTPAEWADALGRALDVIDEHLPVMSPELELMLAQVVPVGYHAERHFSASLMEVVGNVYMSLHPDTLTLAEAIVHEFSHNKINALWCLAPLLENAFEPLYPSPVRPDPRPLFGVLLAAHAFLPVEAMYFSLAQSDHPVRHHPRFEARRRQIRRLNEEAVTTVLSHGRPTEMGLPVLDELRRVNDAHARAAA